MSSLPGFTPLAPINRPTPSLISESQFKAIHPPAQHFRHVSTPFATASKQGTAIPFASIRALPQSRQLSLSGTRTPSLHSGYGYRTHKRSQSAGIIPTYPQPFPQAAPPNLGSSRSSSSGSASFPRSGLSHMRNASDPHAIIISQRRARDYDMAVRLEQKLAEVQARLERQQSQSTSSSDGKDARLPLPAPAPLLIKKSQSAVELRKSYVGGDLGLSVTEDVGAGFLMDDFAFGGEGAKTAKGEEERFLDAEEESVKSTSKVGEEVKNEDDKAIIREEGANDMDIS
ncbi:hypothetical protein EJ08DRAFT_644438 [Tothia fuscella]|uniref:Uncharacterized protein n=1 Tax=Tothia fuscella TaxID=1048955 RepID=A0A9P4P3Q4_9PEZI|nr:hypothetical protein EJ08DRAFT_644438 [Tothia fuscella]